MKLRLKAGRDSSIQPAGSGLPPTGGACCPRVVSGRCVRQREAITLQTVSFPGRSPTRGSRCLLMGHVLESPPKSPNGAHGPQPRNLRFSCPRRSREHPAVVCGTSPGSPGERAAHSSSFFFPALGCLSPSSTPHAHLGAPGPQSACQLPSRLLRLQSQWPATGLRVVCSHQTCLFVEPPASVSGSSTEHLSSSQPSYTRGRTAVTRVTQYQATGRTMSWLTSSWAWELVRGIHT